MSTETWAKYGTSSMFLRPLSLSDDLANGYTFLSSLLFPTLYIHRALRFRFPTRWRWLLSALFLMPVWAAVGADSGSLYQKLTLSPGANDTVDPAGPLYYKRTSDTTRIWAHPPFFSYTLDED